MVGVAAYSISSSRTGLFSNCLATCTILIVALLLTTVAFGQTYATSTGVVSDDPSYPVEMGSVDAGSGNLHLRIPLASFPQRGLGNTDLALTYNSNIWTASSDEISTAWQPNNILGVNLSGGWSLSIPGMLAQGTSPVYPSGCNYGGPIGCFEDVQFIDPDGTQRWFSTPSITNGSTSVATDYGTSGLSLTYNNAGFYTLTDPNGTVEYNTFSPIYGPEDSNGNYITRYETQVGTSWMWLLTDTLGRSPYTLGSGPGCTFTSSFGPKNVYSTCYQVLTASGTRQTYSLTLADITLKTSFGIGTECTTNCYTTVVTAIKLPNGSSYSFLYDCDKASNVACGSATGQGAYYGTLTSMTLPTGQQVTYGYTNYNGPSQGSNHNQVVSHWLQSKSSSAGTWTYIPLATAGWGPQNNCLPNYQVGCATTTVSKPDGSKDVISFIVDPAGGAYPQTVSTYDTDGLTLLRKVTNNWIFSNICYLVSCQEASAQYGVRIGYVNVAISSRLLTVSTPSGSLTSKTVYQWELGSPQTGNIAAIETWGFRSGDASGATFPSVPDRATYTTYYHWGNNSKPATVTTCNNTGTSDSNCGAGGVTVGGTTVSRTTMSFDRYGTGGTLALTTPASGSTQNHDDSGVGASVINRGNVTQISRLVSGSTYLTNYLSYDTVGNVTRSQDSAGNNTTLSYTDSLYDDTGSDSLTRHSSLPMATNAYLTSISDSVGTQGKGYYFGSGKPAYGADYNGASTYFHYMDVLDRPTVTDYPIGWTETQYTSPTQTDSFAAVGDTQASTTCVSCIWMQSIVDSLGRPISNSVINNPAGGVTVTYTYDALNQVRSTSHPHIGSGDPNNVVDTVYRDGLGNVLETRHPDGQLSRVAYGPKVANLGGLTVQQGSSTTYGYGVPVVSVDEAGKQKQEWIDGFGQVIEVDEPSSSASDTASANLTISGAPRGSDTGSLTVTVTGTGIAAFSATANWINCSTPSSVAASLAKAFNTAQSPVTASANGATVTMLTVGFSPSFSVSYTLTDFTASPASGAFSGGGGGLKSGTSVTNYTYDALGNLTGVAEGVQTRSYQYDGLSRLTSANDSPDAGTVGFSYKTSAGGLCSGNPSNPCTRTDGRNIVTTYSYDSANRLIGKTHSPSTTGAESYQYGSSAASFNIGRLILMTDPSGSESYTYDAMGHIKSLTKAVGGVNYTTSYTYNVGGQVTQVTYPSGRSVAYGYDNVGHLCQVAGTTSGCSSATNIYITLPSTSYDASGRPLLATYGNGVIANSVYSSLRSQLTSIRYSKGNSTLFGLVYYYQNQPTECISGSTVGNNGQIQCILDFVQPSRSLSFTYDPLGRLSTAFTNGSTPYPKWGLAESYDRYGNRVQQQVTSGTGYASGPFTFNGNRNSLYTYDGSGNLTATPSPAASSYTYDGEECLTSYAGNGNSATYLCDGNNFRVKKTVGGVPTVYIRSGGNVIAEYDNGAAVNSPSREYIYGAHRIATITGSVAGAGGTITYEHRDHASPRFFTDLNGTCVGDQAVYPFGELWYSNNDPNCGTSASSSWMFTTYERDSESGLSTGNDYALARSFSASQGRFLSPDPISGNPQNPQSLNRYGYAGNDPVNVSDPSGQDPNCDMYGVCTDSTVTGSLGGDCNSGGICSGGSLSFGNLVSSASWINGGLGDNFVQFNEGNYLNPTSGYAACNSSLCGFFPTMSSFADTSSASGANESGALDEMLGSLSNIYDSQVRWENLFVATYTIAPAALGPLLGLRTPEVEMPDFLPAGGFNPVIRPYGGQAVYRVFGGDSSGFGQSWSPVDPSIVSGYRDVAGLPSAGESGFNNSGQFIAKGVIVDPNSASVMRAESLDGNAGGLVEYRIPNWSRTGAIRLQFVGGLNPPY